MSQASVRRKPNEQPALLDTELEHLPPELRWREWMGRVEAVIFAASEPVPRDVLARVVGKSCNLDLVIDDIRAELAGRPYELVSVAGGWQHRPRRFLATPSVPPSAHPRGRGQKNCRSRRLLSSCASPISSRSRAASLSSFFGKEVSRDLIGVLRAQDLIASGPRSPQPGAPYTYVTTKTFLSQFGLDTLRQLPDFEALEDAGLLSKDKLLAGGIPAGLADGEGEDDVVEEQVP
ncbi:SMC-Scp complex subunit ScpB [Mesorhizobium sp. VK24D]|uniref:SMC-Scp complex subunit ScpB n=1 Tax=Mesorhizobium album TaxID=3072314 RepID=A0ABU4XYQ0_9HYPH|nr:SMC-Scp complex subunit ScpB [Mesorhizobium sp. VK24D]MDX8479822.1 SMC-Scp complex subunit ScpB [Mesorhizobium sp. VK24D]